jgi:hypoxanthine phosphoribosyltransferase
MTKLLYDEQAVNDSIRELAGKVVEYYAGKNPLFICLLRGGAPFATKLMFEIAKIDPDFHPEMDYLTIGAYGDKREGGAPELINDLTAGTETVGRQAVLIDDTLDKGITAAFAEDYLNDTHNVAAVDLIVLVEKNNQRERFATATMSCFTAGPEWLTGMGLDDTATAKEAHRWANTISIVE